LLWPIYYGVKSSEYPIKPDRFLSEELRFTTNGRLVCRPGGLGIGVLFRGMPGIPDNLPVVTIDSCRKISI